MKSTTRTRARRGRAQRFLQMLGARGAHGEAADALRKADEIRALRLDAAARNIALVHLVDDFLGRVVVPDDHGQRA